MQDVLQLLQFEADRSAGGPVARPVPGAWFAESGEPFVFGERAAGTVPLLPLRIARGNALELWAAVHDLSVYAAAVDLCQQLGLEIPWVTRW